MIQLLKPCRGPMTQRYFNKQSHNGLPHTGNDYGYYFGGSALPEVFAAADGEVVYAGDSRDLGWPNPYYFNPDFDRSDRQDSSAGKVLVLRHKQDGRTFLTTYSHLESFAVRRGWQVSAGQHMATIGETGFSAGKHLHFELIFLPSNFNTITYGRSDPNPFFVAGIAAAGTTTEAEEAEEIDMAAVDTLMAQLEQMVTWEHERFTILRAQNSALLQMVVNLDSTFRFIKVNGNDTLYEVERGEARPIGLPEWQAKGGLEPRIVEQWILDGLTAAAPAPEGK